ncbi:MAG TPA: hypothetical protein VF066_13820 [Thermoleophilaceae bacterium]
MSLQALRQIAMLTLLGSVVAFAGCGGSGSAPSTRNDAIAKTTTSDAAPKAPARRWTSGYPNSIAVLGHSGSTGENSDPSRPGVEVRENSWATGSNPAVRSLYGRILERNPAIKGHNVSYSEGGADIDRVGAQADGLLAREPKAELIVIQVMDSDLTCPLDRDALATFEAKLTAILRKLAREAPNSSEFVVSQFGSVPTYARSLTRSERASQGGTGPCDFMTPTGGIAREKVARLERAIHAYEGALAAACKKVRSCTYDAGAFGRIVDRRDYVSSDLNHFSVKGHAKAAAVAWAAMRRAHVVPRNGP